MRLQAVKVHGNDPVHADKLQDLGYICRTDRDCLVVEPTILTRVSIVRGYDSNTSCTCAFASTYHKNQLHQVVIDGPLGRLDYVAVSTDDIMSLELHVDFAIGKPADFAFGKGRAEMFGNRLSKLRARVASK